MKREQRAMHLIAIEEKVAFYLLNYEFNIKRINITEERSISSINPLKGAEATHPKILTKNSNTLLFYSKLYLTFLRSCCENIFKIVCIVSEKIGK